MTEGSQNVSQNVIDADDGATVVDRRWQNHPNFANVSLETARLVGVPVDLLLSLLDDVFQRSNFVDIGVELRRPFTQSKHFLGFPNFPLTDPMHHNGYVLSLNGPLLSVKSVCTELACYLLCSIDSGDAISKLRVVLWCSVVTRNHAQILRCLEAALDLGSFELVATQSLLVYSVQHGDLRLLRLFLEYGVSPNCLDSFYPQPLMQAARLGSMTTLITAKDANALFSRIVHSLIKFGASTVEPSMHGSLPVHCLYKLAVVAPSVATLLIRKTQPHGFNAMSDEFSDKKRTPLAKALHAVAVSVPNHLSHVTKIIYYAILPLMRIGAPLAPDDVLTSWYIFRGLAKWDARESVALWGRPHMLARIYLEARQSSGLTAGCLDSYSSAFERPSSSDAHKFAAFIRSSFPRPLQAICRTEILRQLPRGVVRSGAIDALSLPASLTGFLKFEELDFPIKSSRF